MANELNKCNDELQDSVLQSNNSNKENQTLQLQIKVVERKTTKLREEKRELLDFKKENEKLERKCVLPEKVKENKQKLRRTSAREFYYWAKCEKNYS